MRGWVTRSSRGVRSSAWGFAAYVVIAPGCTPASIVPQYSTYSACPKDRIDVAGVRGRNAAYRASGCGNGATFLCLPDSEECRSPEIVVAHRHAKQFSCSVWQTEVEDLGADLYLARGCNHPTTYQCYFDIVHVVRCIAETTAVRESRQKRGL
jgi:hypothetical protein